MPGGTVTFPKDFGRPATDGRQNDARFLDKPGEFSWSADEGAGRCPGPHLTPVGVKLPF
jgi:hypothetical protein